MAENKKTAKKYNDVNSLTIGGRLTADAEIKTGEKDGRKWKQIRFTLASNEDDETMYINCSIFVPETFQAKGFVKGAQVTVIGRLKVKMGEKRPFIDIAPHSLDDIQITRGAAPAAKAEEPAAEASTTDEDIPF